MPIGLEQAFMELSVQSEDGDLLRLQAEGRITQSSMPADLAEQVSGLLGRCGFGRRVLMSLAGVDFIDSSGLSWLVVLHRRFGEAKGVLVLHSVPMRVLETIRVMSLDRVLKIAEDEAVALAVMRGEAPHEQR